MMNKFLFIILLTTIFENYSQAVQPADKELEKAIRLSLKDQKITIHKPTPDPIRVLNADNEAPTQLFLQRVRGDGNCAFYAFAVSRERVQQQLLHVLDTPTHPDRELLLKAMNDLAKRPEGLTIEKIRMFLKGKFLNKSYYLTINSDPSKSLGALIAKLNNFTLEIYLNDKHIRRAEGINRIAILNPGQPDVRRIFFNGINHYDRLIPEIPTAEHASPEHESAAISTIAIPKKSLKTPKKPPTFAAHTPVISSLLKPAQVTTQQSYKAAARAALSGAANKKAELLSQIELLKMQKTMSAAEIAENKVDNHLDVDASIQEIETKLNRIQTGTQKINEFLSKIETLEIQSKMTPRELAGNGIKPGTNVRVQLKDAEVTLGKITTRLIDILSE